MLRDHKNRKNQKFKLNNLPSTPSTHTNNNSTSDNNDVSTDVRRSVTKSNTSKKFNCFTCGSTEHLWRQCPVASKLAKNYSKGIVQEKSKKICMTNLSNNVASDVCTSFITSANTIDITSEKCHVIGVSANQIDFILDHGTESGVANTNDSDILCCFHNQNVMLNGIGSTLSTLTGQSMFGQTRLVDGYVGSVLVSQFQYKEAYECVEVPGCPGNYGNHFKLVGRLGTAYSGLEWNFFRDFDRYNDNLLHCTLPRGQARKFAQGVDIDVTNEKAMVNKV